MIVETKVPDMVTSTCNPFLLSLPTTTIDGNEWNYDVTVYPKNATGMPDLEKNVRESKADTGKTRERPTIFWTAMIMLPPPQTVIGWSIRSSPICLPLLPKPLI
jgi:hypothetical protein